MAILSAAVNPDGSVNIEATPNNTKESTVGKSSLGKDAFLNLLIAQMQNQDPLNPSSDTEWIAQMAQFSALEEMQNMGQTMENTQALGLVGQYVIMSTTLSTGESSLVGGQVDYVVIQSGKAYLAVSNNGTSLGLFPIDELDTVTNKEYIDNLYNQGGEDDEEDETTEETTEEKLLSVMDKLAEGIDSVNETMGSVAEKMDEILAAGGAGSDEKDESVDVIEGGTRTGNETGTENGTDTESGTVTGGETVSGSETVSGNETGAENGAAAGGEENSPDGEAVL